MPTDKMIDLGHLDEIEIRRNTAFSKAECEEIRADLERQRFQVTVREHDLHASDRGCYSAEIFAEKRTPLTEKELAAASSAREKQEKARRRGYRILWLAFGAAILLVLLLLLIAFSPLIDTIRMVL
jgi:predicted nucleic acid-binding Zn ribbon protein